MNSKSNRLRNLNQNPISAFMEYGQGQHRNPEIKIIDSTGPQHCPIFTAAAFLDNEEVARDKRSAVQEARVAVAEKALRLQRIKINPQKPNRTSHEESRAPVFQDSKNPVSLLVEYSQFTKGHLRFEGGDPEGPDHCPRFTSKFVLGSRCFEAAESGNKSESKRKAAENALLTLHREGKKIYGKPIVASLTSRHHERKRNQSADNLCPPGKNPVQVLNEFAQSKHYAIQFKELGQSGPPHKPSFKMAVCLNGINYRPGKGPNKSETKTRAAILVLKKLREKGEYGCTSGNEEETVDLTVWENKIADISHKAFDTVIKDLPQNLSGRKVIAAIILLDTRKDKNLSVISIGAGNRCISGDALSNTGDTVQDSHAEVIAKRGFRRYLYDMLEGYYEGSTDTIFERGDSGKFKLSSNFSFHMYISTAPCGDGALFTHNDANDDARNGGRHYPIFDNKRQGQLRTKMENGEGTIPVDEDAAQQTWDGIRRGERLRTMSCSDKMCRWNVLGIQGSLLSLFLEPVYLKSVTLGQLYNHGHLSRALCCRHSQDSDRLARDLPPDFSIHHPDLGCADLIYQRIPGKSSPFSLNWNIMDLCVEVTNGLTGKVEPSSNQTRSFRNRYHQTSRLCKAELYSKFKHLCQTSGRMVLLRDSYAETKSVDKDYALVKEKLENNFIHSGYGGWVSKPEEVDLFS